MIITNKIITTEIESPMGLSGSTFWLIDFGNIFHINPRETLTSACSISAITIYLELDSLENLTHGSAVVYSWRLFGQRSDAEKVPTVNNP